MILRRALWILVVVAFAFGTLYRLVPLVLGPDALAQFFITEDGYLMLTVARNLAIGNGLSVSGGAIATNGVQPLATLIYAIPYLVTGGAKTASLVGIILIATAWSVAGVVAVHRFARGVLTSEDGEPLWPLLAAALWFVGPLMLLHTMNGLETGLYILAVAMTVTYFGHVTARGARYTVREQVIFGSLCGLVFLARNDGAFLVTALFAVRFLYMVGTRRLSFGAAVAEMIPPGIISLVWAAPWLIHNKVYFGSIVPISGPAQSLAAEFGANLDAVPSKLFETMFTMLPVPGAIEKVLALQILTAVIPVAVMVIFLWQLFARSNPFRVAVLGYTVYALMILGYYGLHFGAQHFLTRYFAPLSPLLVVAAVWVMRDLSERLFRSRGELVLAGAGSLAIMLSMVLLGRMLLPGVKEQGHFHVVGWVSENVPEEAWVGAVQTGTLGYWHDRTINLDGKVNPAALAARRAVGNVLAYVVDSEIDYIADWKGVAAWGTQTDGGFDQVFEVIVNDRDGNLAVLKRREAAGG
ncbi:hypothetical protein [Primorskyibacter sedentarius]|uniref:hypothetical protein n=1 Tax=Primorskyibacter sedentarius TaxID=745311 RepID=UPI003EB893E2